LYERTPNLRTMGLSMAIGVPDHRRRVPWTTQINAGWSKPSQLGYHTKKDIRTNT